MENTALIIIDLQNDYFGSIKDAKWPLYKTEKAAENTLKILTKAREKNLKIVHVRHEFQGDNPPFFAPNTKGSTIHESLTPKENESQVLKNGVNAFLNTDLKAILDESNITNVIIVGAMSYMCIDAVTRAASDYGYNCFLAHDACATSNIEFNGVKVEAKLAHATIMAALSFAYANVQTSEEILKQI